jgi:hypothetical protein
MIHNAFSQDPVFQHLYGTPEDPQGDLAVDYAGAKLMYGSGFGDMEIKDVKAAYDGSMPVKVFQETATKMPELERLLTDQNVTSQEAALKILAKIIDPGIVTDADRAAVANRGYTSMAAFRNQVEALETGALNDTQRKEILDTAKSLIMPRKQAAVDLQNRYKKNLGHHPADVVFANTGILTMEDNESALGDPPPPPTDTDGWVLEEDKDGNRAYVNPNDRTQFRVVK